MTAPDPLPPRRASAAQPLLGVTLLVVEDSRLACEGLRLLAGRSGARLRRADSLESAERHLRAWRPGAVILDLHLPDGSGLDLLARLAAARPRIPAILATSGDPALEGAARRAGADGFLPKPVLSLSQFQAALLARLPAGRPVPLSPECVAPDPAALRDDLAAARALIGRADRTAYLTGFLRGVARSAGDTPLSDAVEAVAARPASRSALARLARLIEGRLDAAPAL
jgi:CheY-like chemotaxis protein